MRNEEVELIQGENGLEVPFSGGNWVLKREFGYSPVQSLAAAIGGCGAYVYQSLLEKAKIPFVFHTVKVTYDRNTEKKAEPLRSVTVTFEVAIPEHYQARAEKVLRLVSENCPVIQSLDPEIEISETLMFR